MRAELAGECAKQPLKALVNQLFNSPALGETEEGFWDRLRWFGGKGTQRFPGYLVPQRTVLLGHLTTALLG